MMEGITSLLSSVSLYPVSAEEIKFDPRSSPTQSNFGLKVRELEQRNELPLIENTIHHLQSCRQEKNPQSTLHLHKYIHISGLETNTVIGNHLVPTLIESGSLLAAQQIFLKLEHPNEHCWTSLMRGFADHQGDVAYAIHMYHKMQENHVQPTMHTFLVLLQASASSGFVKGGFEVHAEIIKEGFEEEVFVGNALVDMYAKCGSFGAALEVFDALVSRDVVSWTALISGYVEHLLGEEALCLFKQMQLKRASPNAVTILCSLKAAELVKDIDAGHELHAMVLKLGFEEDAYLGSALIGTYAACKMLEEAQEIFNNLQVRDTISWNALITGYADNTNGEETLKCLDQMQQEGLSQNAVSFACSLTACAHLGALERGQEVHADIVRDGFENDLCVSSSLIDMYAKCGIIEEARDVFDTMPVRGLVSWSALITGYAQNEHGKEALSCFKLMLEDGFSPDAVTLSSCLKACGSIQDICTGQEVHLDIVKKGLENSFTESALVSMYAKCGHFSEAEDVFHKCRILGLVLRNALMVGYAEHGMCKAAQACLEKMQLEGVPPNVVTWNAAISAVARHGESAQAFSLYAQMQEQALLPDKATTISILSACGDKTALEEGRKLHTRVHTPDGSEGPDPVVATAIIDMYSKCGSMVDAQLVFDAMPSKDLVGWTALIAGYGRQGESELVFYWFERMKQEGLRPNQITFQSVLSACSHLGLVDRGQTYFNAMIEEYGISPTIQHYNCMVDLHKRAGQWDEAAVKVENMPYEPNRVTWGTVLSGG